MKFILGKKLGMTQVFRDTGVVVPVTRVQAGPCVVTQVKEAKGNGVNAVQLGFGEQKAFRLKKAQQGHLKGLTTVRFMRDIATKDDEHGLKRGDTFGVTIFEPGEKVQVVGRAKGRGFQGVVKRHGFKGASASHGTKDQVRMPGSIGATGPARVFKGTRMGGHMGDNRVTVKNLEIVQIDTENNELLIKGAVPGARGGLLIISTDEGKIEIEEEKAPEAEKTEEAPVAEETAAEEKTEEAQAEAPVEEVTEEKKEEAAAEETKEEAAPEAPAEEAPAAEDPSADAQDEKTEETTDPSANAQDK